MLTLWYIILGWKEYNKPFIKREPEKPADSAKKPDLIPQKKDGVPTDNLKPETLKPVVQPKSQPPAIPPRASETNNRSSDGPKFSEALKQSVPKDIPKIPDNQSSVPVTKGSDNHKLPDLPKVAPPTPEKSKISELPKINPTAPKTPELPKNPAKAPDSSKLPEVIKASLKNPKTPESPKFPEPQKDAPKTIDSPKVPKLPKDATPPDTGFGMMPSKRPESAIFQNFPPSRRNPASTPSDPEFPLPSFIPGTPPNQTTTNKADELFAPKNNLKNQKESGDFKHLSYSKGELPEEVLESKPKKAQPKPPSKPNYVPPYSDSVESSEGED